MLSEQGLAECVTQCTQEPGCGHSGHLKPGGQEQGRLQRRRLGAKAGGWGQEPAAAEVKGEGKPASRGASEAEPLSWHTVVSPPPTILGAIQSF